MAWLNLKKSFSKISSISSALWCLTSQASGNSVKEVTTMSMDSHNYKFSGRKNLSSSARHSIDAPPRPLHRGSLIYLADITFPAPFSTSCWHFTKPYFFQISYDSCSPPNFSSFKAMIQFLNKYNLLYTISFLSSKLASCNQKTLILPLWGDAALKMIAKANHLPRCSAGKALAALKSIPGTIHSSSGWFRRFCKLREGEKKWFIFQ